ncbi:hypothetical protein, partial [Klebsiella pneumoniae]|uniref:hypothetical protein n=1 Tax=Klebsiella pneumoniae TaxID=573 RepID=UPI002752BFB4|nr:hypothetical protein [Klebsiella pneumoniae]
MDTFFQQRPDRLPKATGGAPRGPAPEPTPAAHGAGPGPPVRGARRAAPPRPSDEADVPPAGVDAVRAAQARGTRVLAVGT